MKRFEVWFNDGERRCKTFESLFEAMTYAAAKSFDYVCYVYDGDAYLMHYSDGIPIRD